MPRAVDVTVTNEGSIWLFYPVTPQARSWVEENVQLEGWQWLGDAGFCVEHRCVPDLVDGMREDGLVVVRE